MKNIMLVCERSNIDQSLRRCLAHLIKSCEIKIVADGYEAFQELVDKAYNLIIFDFEITGIDSLELIESVSYIDPDVPIILMLKQQHQTLSQAAQALKANPILRPFKPLSFLRLVDKLLHQHLERYRGLSESLQNILDSLVSNTAISCAFLVDDGSQVLMHAGQIEPALLPALARLTTAALASEQTGQSSLSEPVVAATPEAGDHDLYILPVVENLRLSLIFPQTVTTPLAYCPPLKQALAKIRHLIQATTAPNGATAPDGSDLTLAEDETPLFSKPIPLTLNPISPVASAPIPDEPYDLAINWQIITGNTPVLDRLQRVLGG